MAGMSARTILDLLREKHAEDVFVPECKGGPTWGGEHSRLDAWVMKKSWAHPLVIGYEIKVSRSDFINDQKWHNYLPYCNEFYFVAPQGIINASELPPEAGLLTVASTGTRLFKKKVSIWRDVVVPEELYRYLLMNRTQIINQHETVAASREQKLAYWRKWLEEEKEGKGLGYLVSERVAAHVRKVERDNERLQDENMALATFRDRLTELGVVDPGQPVNRWHVPRAIDTLRGKIPPHLLLNIRRTIQELAGVQAFLESQKED